MISKYSKVKALSIIAQKLGRTVYYMLKRKEPFVAQRFFADGVHVGLCLQILVTQEISRGLARSGVTSPASFIQPLVTNSMGDRDRSAPDGERPYMC